MKIDLHVLNTRPAPHDGTYSICSGCPSSKNCCSRVKRGGSVDAPVLLPDDVTAIVALTGQRPDLFSYAESGYPALRRMTEHDGCLFYRDGQCTIYDARPIDCRLFPFDIVEKSDGRLVWVAYTDLCPVEYTPFDYFDQVKPLLKLIQPHVRAFARVQAPGMCQQVRIELGEV